jgi:Domain of unknown function (DUF5668)
MNDRPAISGRMVWGLVVLTLGILWTLDNLGQIDASQVVRWWPLVALAWGVTLLVGAGNKKPIAGWIWTIIGATSLVRPLGIADADVFDFWPMLLVVLGAGIVWRAWTGREFFPREAGRVGPKIDASAYFAGSQRKVVTDEFSAADVDAVIAATTLDLRPARLAGGAAVVDVFALWGGIDLIVPGEWRVVSDVTPILGVFQDLTVVPADPSAPTLIVRGSVVMGGIEVRNDERKSTSRVRTVKVGPGTVTVIRDEDETPRSAGNA